MNPQPKVKPWRSIPYRQWVASLPCCICGSTTGTNAHHEQEEGKGTMGGKCCDSRCIPLCVFCHADRHDMGRAFWTKQRFLPESHVAMTRNRWEFEKGGRPWE